MRTILYIFPLLLTISTYGQGVIDNYKASWVGNSFGHAPGAKWVQNYINEIKVTADGTVYTKSHWDEGGRKFGVYKDGDVIGNQSVVINGKSVVIDGKTWSISGNIINGPGGKKITDVVKPTSVAKDNQDRLMVTEEGPRQQLLFYDVADEPTLVETFGLEGGIGAHLSIDVAVGERYPAGDYPRGIYHPYKLWGMTGCGMDERGRIFISTSQNGTVLRAFEKNDEDQWMLDWELFGLFFVDAMDVDPNSDGVDVFGVSEHFRMDYTKDGGKEWRLHGYTVDPVKYPDDPRLFEEIKAGHNHGLTSPFIRYINGVKFMFVKGMYSQLYVFRFEDNGQICYPVKTLPNSFSWWIDNAGNYWQANGSKIEQWTFTGKFDEKGAPVHEKTATFETDNDLATIERVMYDDKNDIMYVGGYSRTYPKNGDEWGILGRVVYRFENFSNNKILSPGYPLVLAYDITPASNIASRVFAKDFTFAGDKLFIIWFIRGPHYLESGYAGDRMRGEVSVYKASTGEYEGAIIPTATIGGPEKVGWIDIPNPAVAFERNNGEIILFVEEDGFGKNILYRICESGNCQNTGYILIDSPLLDARYLPGQSVSIKTDHQVSDTIQHVAFYADTIKIGEKTSPPYQMEWSTDIEGKYHISSRAITTAGDTIYSSNSPHIYIYTPAVDSIILSPASSHIQITDSVVFTCRLFDQYGYPMEESIIWEVMGAGSITSDGVFIPADTGTVTIVASIGSVSDTATVSVYAPEISELKIHPAEPMMYTGKELQLHILASDQFGTALQVETEWAILSGEGHIDGHGIFTAGLSPGISRVVAKTEEITDTLDITIILPTGWVNRDIGTVKKPGSATVDAENDIFEVRASGSDIWGNTDQFHYVYKPLDGDGQITARIASFNVTDSWAKVGLMIRGSDSPTAAHVSVFVTGANGVACQFRSFAGGGSTNVPAAAEEVAPPYWLKLDRSGQRFTTYLSADGISWEAFHQFRMTMPDTVLIGLAATSHNNNSLLTATYSHVVSQGFDPVRVGGLSLDIKSLELIVGATRPLKATLTPNNPTINTILWKSTNRNVATVSQTGLVSTLMEGEALIIATSVDGAYSDTCHVAVNMQLRPSTDPGFEREQLTIHPVWGYEGDIVIDGIANEAFWDMIEPMELNHDVTNAWWTEGSKPIDPKYKESGDYHLLWRAAMDEEFFYIFCEIIDDDLQSRSMHTGGESQENDNIELYFCFSEDCCPGDWCGFNYFAAVRVFADLNEQTGDTLIALGLAGGIAGNESYQPMGYKSRTVATPSGYNIEARIPFALIIPSEEGRYGDYNDNDEWIDIVITDLKPFLFDITGNDRDEGKVGPTGGARHLIANWSANWNRNWYSTEGYGIATMGETLFPDDTNVIIQSARNIHIYPNPASETISIRDTSPESRISIYTTLGQTVYHDHALGNDTHIDISSLKKGIYLVHVLDRQGIQAIGRFVKQ